MTHYTLEPEVAGGWGETTVADTTAHPPIVSRLEYCFDGWLGDDLLESFPCYIATERLCMALEQSGMTGFVSDDVTVTTSEQFRDSYPTKALPEFRWLRVTGQAGVDDFGLGDTLRLVVSNRALELLKQYNLEHCDIELSKS